MRWAVLSLENCVQVRWRASGETKSAVCFRNFLLHGDRVQYWFLSLVTVRFCFLRGEEIHEVIPVLCAVYYFFISFWGFCLFHFFLFRKRWFPFRNTNGEWVYFTLCRLKHILFQVSCICYIPNLKSVAIGCLYQSTYTFLLTWVRIILYFIGEQTKKNPKTKYRYLTLQRKQFCLYLCFLKLWGKKCRPMPKVQSHQQLWQMTMTMMKKHLLLLLLRGQITRNRWEAIKFMGFVIILSCPPSLLSLRIPWFIWLWWMYILLFCCLLVFTPGAQKCELSVLINWY